MGTLGSKQTVAKLNPMRYQGLWWEVAANPFIYEVGCEFSSAIYSYNTSNGSISVLNTCYMSNGEKREAKGTANVPCKEYPGRLYVSFENSPKGYPTLYDIRKGNYWVIYTDYDNFSVVISPDESLMWLLSRSSSVDIKDIQCIITKVESMGYNTSSLIINKKLIKS